MKKQCLSLSVFTLIILLFFSFSCKNQEKKGADEERPEEKAAVEEESQISSPIKVATAKRTRNYSWSKLTPVPLQQPDGTVLLSFESEIISTKSNEQEGNVVLVLRIEGISVDKFDILADQDKINVISDKKHYILNDCDTHDEVEIERKVISPWIVCIFTIPQNIKKMKLVVGDHPPVKFEAESEVFEILRSTSLI